MPGLRRRTAMRNWGHHRSMKSPALAEPHRRKMSPPGVRKAEAVARSLRRVPFMSSWRTMKRRKRAALMSGKGVRSATVRMMPAVPAMSPPARPPMMCEAAARAARMAMRVAASLPAAAPVRRAGVMTSRAMMRPPAVMKRGLPAAPMPALLMMAHPRVRTAAMPGKGILRSVRARVMRALAESRTAMGRLAARSPVVHPWTRETGERRTVRRSAMTGPGLRPARALGRPTFAIRMGMLIAVFRLRMAFSFLSSEGKPAASGSAAHSRRSETAAAEAAAAKRGTAETCAAIAAPAEAAAAKSAAKTRAAFFAARIAAPITVLRRPIGLAAGLWLVAFAIGPPWSPPSLPRSAPAGKAELRSAAFGRARRIGAIGVFRSFLVISPGDCGRQHQRRRCEGQVPAKQLPHPYDSFNIRERIQHRRFDRAHRRARK